MAINCLNDYNQRQGSVVAGWKQKQIIYSCFLRTFEDKIHILLLLSFFGRETYQFLGEDIQWVFGEEGSQGVVKSHKRSLQFTYWFYKAWRSLICQMADNGWKLSGITCRAQATVGCQNIHVHWKPWHQHFFPTAHTVSTQYIQIWLGGIASYLQTKPAEALSFHGTVSTKCQFCWNC